MIVVTGRMFRSVLPYVEAAGIDDPVVCYQGAVVADPRTGEFLRHEPIPLELAREAIAAVVDEGFHVNCYVDDELYVAEATPQAERYAGFQNLPLHEVGDLAAWLSAPPTKLVAIDDPDALDGLEARHEGPLRRTPLHLEVAAVLPEFASPEVTKGSGSASSPSTSGSRASARSPSGTARTTSSCSSGPASAWRSPTRTRARSRSPTGSAPRPRKREWPRSWKRF